jgi:hypothetical protein
MGMTTSFSRKQLNGADYWAEDFRDVPEEVLSWSK